MNRDNQDQHIDTPEQSKARDALTEETRRRIGYAVRVGVDDRFAARYAGIPYRWLRRWIKTGKRAREPFEDDYQRQCVMLYAELEKARGDYVVNTLCKIEKAGGQHWPALAWKFKQFLMGYPFRDAQKKHPKKEDIKRKKQEKWNDQQS